MITKSYLNKLLNTNRVKSSRVFFESYKLNESVLKYDIFLSYSFNDLEYASVIAQLLISHGFTVYFEKKPSVSIVSRATVERIAKMMDSCRSLLYIHTQSSTVSKWCPWELGYMSGKTNFRCATIPIVDNEKTYIHQEYLKIYPYVNYILTQEGKHSFCVFDIYNKNKCLTLHNFINGCNP